MLKGVNKLIIEVSNPESDFFERAIFFVKPDKSDIVTKDINKSVCDIINKAGRIEPRRNSRTALQAVKLTAAAVSGAAIALLAFIIFL